MTRSITLAILLMLAVRAIASSEKTKIILNDAEKGVISLDISDGNPCLTRSLLEEWGLRSFVIEKLTWDAGHCMTAASADQYVLQYTYQPDKHQLTMTFPEEALNAQQNGISTSRWDDGIKALFVNYRLNVDNQRAQYSWEKSGTDATLALENGLNVGPWRLRYQNTFWREKGGQHGSYSDSISLWRSLTPLRSRLTVGDGYTSVNMFDGMQFRGLSLASDEKMYPDSWRPYSPLISGYAHTEAEVTIHQNGERVYRIHVPPGPFTLRDFYPPDAQGNLQLTIKESDGTERTRELPWSMMPNLVQHNLFSYELVAGHYRPARGWDVTKDRFWQGSLSWGIAPHLTIFGGLQQGRNYVSQVMGAGGNLGKWGALSADISTASYSQQNETLNGSVWRLRYAKSFFLTETGMNAQLQWYPVGSQYRSMEEKIDQAASLKNGWGDTITERALVGQLELTQNFSEDSSLTLSWRWQKSRTQNAGKNSVELRLDTDWNDIDISVYGSYDRTRDSAPESKIGFNISIPFTFGSHNSNIALISDLANRDKNSHGLNVYGSELDDYSLRYDVTALHTVHGDDSLSTTLGYQYNAGELNLSQYRGGDRRDYHADVSGSIVLHDEGVTLGQSLGSAMALVEVPNTPDISFYNQFGATTNADGELIVSYLTPWRANNISVDSLSLPDNYGMEVEEQIAVPTDGAIIKLRYPPPAIRKEDPQE